MKTPAQRTKLMRRITRETESWCKHPTTDRRAEDQKSLAKWLRSNQPRAAGVAAMHLRYLAAWYAHHGALAILKHEHAEKGWQHMDHVLKYHLWEVRIVVVMTPIKEAALYLAHAITFEEHAMARWLARRMIDSLDDEALQQTVFSGWQIETFATFMLHLWTIQTGASPEPLKHPRLPSLGVYKRVLDAWENVDELKPALENACDFHLDQAFDQHDSWKLFESSPYDIFPVDMLAIARVRAQLGLPMPEIDHPLMQTPLAKPPPNDVRPRMPPDPLLDAVIEKARKQGFLPAGDPFAIE